MNNIILNNFRHIHFVGIGGVSMHALAIYCGELGIKISGSDIKVNNYIKICTDAGIKTYIGHKRKNVHGADLVVYTSAINGSNVEILEAKECGIKIMDRAELLAIICKQFKCVIGVSGTHGKTTTCAMIYHILREAGKKVSCHIGADIQHERLNPEDEYLVLECCEYNRSFLKFNCDISVILNIDNDHLDCYGNMYNLQNAFKMFIKRAKTRFVLDGISTRCIKAKVNHIQTAKILCENKFICDNKKYALDNVYGEHNINNATVAIRVCNHIGLSYTKVYKALKSFVSAGRRCELIGQYNTMDIIIDYAHHPNEINAVYNSLKLKYDTVYIIFQPHTYSRTKLLIYDFVKQFVGKDNVIIYKEYPAREHKSQGYSAKKLSECIDNSVYCRSYKSLKQQLLDAEIMENGCIVFVGAGDIYNIGLKFVKEYGIVK